MKLVHLTLSVAAITVTACIKPKSGSVELRLKNATLKNFKSSSSAGAEFGTVDAGTITGYRSFDKVIAFPNAHFVISTDTIYTAGSFACGTSPLPCLEKGKYTVLVFEDSTSFTRFDAKFIKD